MTNYVVTNLREVIGHSVLEEKLTTAHWMRDDETEDQWVGRLALLYPEAPEVVQRVFNRAKVGDRPGAERVLTDAMQRGDIG